MITQIVVPNPAAPAEAGLVVIRRTADCKVCLCQHDEEIHAATLSVREWFRDEVTKSFQPMPLF